jgi:hypothetical protein
MKAVQDADFSPTTLATMHESYPDDAEPRPLVEQTQHFTVCRSRIHDVQQNLKDSVLRPLPTEICS